MTDSERLQNLLGKLEQRLESGDDKFEDIDKKLLDIQKTMIKQGETLAVLKDRSDGSVRAAQKSGAGAGGLFGLFAGAFGDSLWNIIKGYFKG